MFFYHYLACAGLGKHGNSKRERMFSKTHHAKAYGVWEIEIRNLNNEEKLMKTKCGELENKLTCMGFYVRN